jgi:hypothetical protein
MRERAHGFYVMDLRPKKNPPLPNYTSQYLASCVSE